MRREYQLEYAKILHPNDTRVYSSTKKYSILTWNSVEESRTIAHECAKNLHFDNIRADSCSRATGP